MIRGVTAALLAASFALTALSGAMAANSPNQTHAMRHGYHAYGYSGTVMSGPQRHPRSFPHCWGGNCDPRWGHDHF
jgi:Spy/CpxP family protein refolding chaperone